MTMNNTQTQSKSFFIILCSMKQCFNVYLNFGSDTLIVFQTQYIKKFVIQMLYIKYVCLFANFDQSIGNILCADSSVLYVILKWNANVLQKTPCEIDQQENYLHANCANRSIVDVPQSLSTDLQVRFQVLPISSTTNLQHYVISYSVH